ncbi:MAG: isochorismatase [Catenulispora sp. 13_1_20CM_3_70_7]|jgi:nicotinamidase-related amidase|nr:MAG: isochorismatase [Catenulispora sp. 13_1_20CM_3_70_7]
MSEIALIVIDMISAYDHEDAEALVPSARAAVPAIRKLINRAGAAGADVIYVNDNLGRWQSNRDELFENALRGPHPELVEPLRPDRASLFVVKARHSIFYQTPLEYLLGQLEVHRIVLSGQVTEQCILYSALDAHIRHLDVVVARDAVAHIDAELGRAALTMMERNMSAAIMTADEVEFS